LFDISFSSLVTPKVVKFVYVLSMVLIGLLAVVFVLAAFRANAGVGVLTLFVLAPAVSLLYLTYTRMFLEFLIALFRIMENSDQLVALGRSERAPDRPAVPPGPTSDAFAPPGPGG